MSPELKSKIIGGMFALPGEPFRTQSSPPFLKGPGLFLANARSGIAVLVDLLRPTRIWLPSYLCASMLQALNDKTPAPRFYEIDYHLAVKSSDWLSDVQPGDLVVFIDYFGLALSGSCAQKAKELGAWVLEDACQAMLSNDVGRFADFVLFSPPKFIGVPDGGILRFNRQLDSEGIDLEPPPHRWWLTAFSASVLRREFDIYGQTKKWFELFKRAQAHSPAGRYAMSELSYSLINNSFDYARIARRRIENYKYLADRLMQLAIFPHLPDEAVPLGFPIRVNHRDRIRLAMFDHQIYPPVHWPVPTAVPAVFKESLRLADDIMTLPCDQRYDISNMRRMARVLEEALTC